MWISKLCEPLYMAYGGFSIINNGTLVPVRTRVHSLGTIPEWEYTEEKQDAFFWVSFQIPEWTEYYSGHSAPEGGMNRIIPKTVYSEERNIK